MVIVHWLTLALLITAWALGEAVHDARHEGVATIAGYLAHALTGGSILLFTFGRLIVRKIDGVPPAMGDTPMDKLAKGLHHVLYTLLILLPMSGVMLVLTSDLGKAMMSGDAAMLPKKFDGVAAHQVHETLVAVLVLVVVVHLLGALKHQFIMKDGLMDRMSLRRKD